MERPAPGTLNRVDCLVNVLQGAPHLDVLGTACSLLGPSQILLAQLLYLALTLDGHTVPGVERAAQSVQGRWHLKVQCTWTRAQL